jgi:hypothetical protein
MAKKYTQSRQDIETGKDFEADLFGKPNLYHPNYGDFLRSHAEVDERGVYFTYDNAVEIVKNFQDLNNPLNPGRPFAKELRLELAERLFGPERMKDWDRVKFYTAIDTPLDRIHSVDAFFEIETDDGKIIRITLDASKNREKISREKYRADILVGGKGFGEEFYKTNEGFLKYVEQIADEAHREYKEKIERFEGRLDKKTIMR